MTHARGRLALWWLLGTGLLLSAGEAERIRRHITQPALCLASVVLLRGSVCPVPRQGGAMPL